MSQINLVTRFHIESCKFCSDREDVAKRDCPVCSGVGTIEQITVEKVNDTGS